MFTTNSFMRYHRMGFSPRPVRGKGPDQDFAVAYYHDNVQYVFNDYGAFEEEGSIEDMNMTIQNLDYIINSDRHEKVKAVIEHIQRQLRVPVWAEVALDSQLGITFGCSTDIIAQLIMDFPTPEKFQEYKDELIAQLKKLGADIDIDKLPPIEDIKDFILIPSNEKYTVLFENLKVDGVVVEIIDDDDFYIEIDMDGDDDDDDED